jgi:DNA-binding helix-hairpin-helix protein with protein kinase domain
LCEVGIETHTPPELQGRRFSEVVRTPNHDNFGMAVLIFQLLFMGRHPFSGAFLGVGDMPIAKAIAEFRFAYGSRAGTRQMKQPPGTLPLGAVSTQLAPLFERAFEREGMGNRTTPKEWIEGLDKLQKSLRACQSHSGHFYWSALSACPWCEVEARSGLILFNIVVGQESRQSSFNLNQIWANIAAVAPPAAVPYPSSPSLIQVAPSPQAVAMGQEFKRGIGIVVSLLGLNPKRNQARRQVADNIREVRDRLKQLDERWRTETAVALFYHKCHELENLRTQYQELPNERTRMLRELEANRERSQRKKYLDGHLIFWAEIPGVGPGRKAPRAVVFGKVGRGGRSGRAVVGDRGPRRSRGRARQAPGR